MIYEADNQLINMDGFALIYLQTVEDKHSLIVVWEDESDTVLYESTDGWKVQAAYDEVLDAYARGKHVITQEGLEARIHSVRYVIDGMTSTSTIGVA